MKAPGSAARHPADPTTSVAGAGRARTRRKPSLGYQHFNGIGNMKSLTRKTPVPHRPSAHLLARLALLTTLLAALAGSSPAWAAESWMTERQSALSAQRDLERLADQTRQRNSPGNARPSISPASTEQAERAREEQAKAQAQRQRQQQEADAIRQQQRQALEQRFREIDSASADLANRLYQRSRARLAVAQPLVKEGPTSANLSAYCEAMSVYTEGYMTAGAPDPAIAVRSLEAALAVDESHAGCWRTYSQVLRLLSPSAEPIRTRIDYSTIGLAPRDQVEAGRLIEARYRALKAAAERRQASVATYVDASRRLPPPPQQLPERFADWQMLKSMDDPEARYWQSRVHGLGLLGQPVNPQAMREAACSKEAAPYFRNRLNCLLLQHAGVVWGPNEVHYLKVLVDSTADPRDPQYHQGLPVLPQIMSKRADRAIGLSFYANRAFVLADQIGSGKQAVPVGIDPAPTVARHYFQVACKALEEAVSLGYYDGGRDVYNLFACYERGELRAPTGSRGLVFAVLEREGNPSLKTHVVPE